MLSLFNIKTLQRSMKEKIKKIQGRKSYSHHAEVTCAEERRRRESTVFRRESGDVLKVPYKNMADHVKFKGSNACSWERVQYLQWFNTAL